MFVCIFGNEKGSRKRGQSTAQRAVCAGAAVLMKMNEPSLSPVEIDLTVVYTHPPLLLLLRTEANGSGSGGGLRARDIASIICQLMMLSKAQSQHLSDNDI